MAKEISLSTRIAYCVTILGLALPIGLAQSGWVAMATGPSGASSVPIVGPLVCLIVGVYRVYLVAKDPGILNSNAVSGFVRLLRGAGLLLLYVGAAATVIGWLSRPLLRSLMATGSPDGAEYFVVGVVASMLARAGFMGLLLFELSRTRSFERARVAGGV